VPPLVTLFSGPAGCGKTSRLLQRYRAVLAQGVPDSTLWLAPTSRAAADIQARLLGESLPGCFSPGIFTFARFTTWILGRSPQPMRPLSGLMKRHLVRELIEAQRQAGRLEHFGPIAATSGLLDLLCEFIRQMKRLEIWPEQLAEACHQRGLAQKDRELLAIYEAYQQRLLEHNLYDAEGRFWSARDRLREQPVRFELVVADGFSDFTRTEHDMLQTLAEHAAETWITLPLEAEPGREDLFQKPLRTLAELRRRHPNLREESLPRPLIDGDDSTPHASRDASHHAERDEYVWPAMAHLERTLFANPRTVTPAVDTARLEILAAGRQIGEIEMIGRRIKRLLIDGDDSTHHASRDASPHAEREEYVRPGQIAIVFRQPQPLADLVSEVFQRLEIPFFLENAQPLGRSPAVVMLVRLLELDAEDWPMHKLLGVLGNNYFLPAWTPWDDRAAGRAELAIRRLQIPRGRERLLEHLNDGEAASGMGDATSSVYQLLRTLADVFDRLPRFDTLAAHAQAWEALADQVGICRAMRGGMDHSAWKQLHATLGESQRLAQWLGQDAPRLDRKQAHDALRDILGSQAMGVANEEPGRVRVLSAASVRHLKIPYLFLAGLSEKSFPAAERDDGVYSQAERQRLIDAGLPLPSHSDRQTEEMLLFYEAVTAATRRLWLSYPAVDDAGEPLTPSPYLSALECGGSPPLFVTAASLEGASRVLKSDGKPSHSKAHTLSPIPDPADICSLDAFRIRAVADAMDGKPTPLAGFALHGGRGAEKLFDGLEFTLARQNRERFGPSEGMLGVGVAEALAADFPPDRVYSTTELERYAYCPFRYFLEHLLRVEPLEDIALEVDFAQRGQMAHSLLAAFHRRVNEARGQPETPVVLAEADYARIMAEAAAETLSAPGRDSLADALREIDRRKLMEWLASYRDQHAKYDEQWPDCDRPPRPELFEVSFGRKLREGDRPPSTVEPLALTSHDETVRLSGRIDRIDLGQAGGQTIFNILDYKTGGGTRFSVEACQRGSALQLPVYALAASELLLNDRDALPWQGGYWYVSGDGFKPRQALRMYELREGGVNPSDTWEAVRGILEDTVVGLVKAMRRGEFPVWSDDPDCTGRCPFNTVCRINQIRSLGKTWQPAAT